KPTNREKKAARQPKLTLSPSASLRPPDLDEIPKEEEAQNHAICTQHVFVTGDAFNHLDATPPVIVRPQLRVILNEENGNRDDNVGRPLHQGSQRFCRVGLCKDDERHNRNTKAFDPSLGRNKRIVRPNNRNETIRKESDYPALLPNNFRKTNLSPK